MNYPSINFGVLLETSAVLLVIFVGMNWYRTLKFFGPIPWRLTIQMLVFTWHTPKAGLILTCVLIEAFCFGAACSNGAVRPELFALAVLALCPLLMAARPPAVVFLTNSSPRSGDLFRTLRLAIAPLRCVALLDYRRLGSLYWTECFLDNLRTRRENVWKSIVHQLVEIAPVTVVDVRPETGPVASEAFLMLAPERAGRAIFLIGPSGESPALKEHGISPLEYGLRTASDETIATATGRLLMQRQSFIRPQISSCVLDRTVVQDHGVLSRSDLTIVLTDIFDSDLIIRTVIDSRKEVATLVLPGASMNMTDAKKFLELFYGEFSLDAKLAMIVWKRGEMVLIRAAFIVSHAAKLEYRHATTPQREWTFEDWDTPNPVTEAALGFVRELAEQAQRNGQRCRVVDQ